MRIPPVGAQYLADIILCLIIGWHAQVFLHRTLTGIIACQRQPQVTLKILQKPAHIGHAAMQVLHRIGPVLDTKPGRR